MITAPSESPVRDSEEQKGSAAFKTSESSEKERLFFGCYCPLRMQGTLRNKKAQSLSRPQSPLKKRDSEGAVKTKEE